MLHEGSRVKLVIAEVYMEDQGEYTVIAENEAGSARSTCDVTVIGTL